MQGVYLRWLCNKYYIHCRCSRYCMDIGRRIHYASFSLVTFTVLETVATYIAGCMALYVRA